MVDADNILVYYERDNDICVFKAKNEYRLEKLGIPAYKISIIDYTEGDEFSDVTNSSSNDYLILLNSCPKGLVGLLIALKNNITISKNQVLFSKKLNSKNEVIEQETKVDDVIPKTTFDEFSNFNNSDLTPVAGSSKTSLFDKYYVEPRRKL
uniref:Tlp20 n=1 Tax=Cryptophlebia leucotreta granulosis virus TaxID=35254 RepID=A0A2H4ZKG8_GVCL|nr:tlp20 [Cryptophlebia leucotreta granulovirus]